MTRPASVICPADADGIARAVTLLREGALVALPTETVYGLAADAANPDAVTRIFAAKGRPADHPLIVHLASGDGLDEWAAAVPEAARLLAAAFWPGPLTLILRKKPCVAGVVTGGQDTVGLRVPDHPVALALLRAFGGGLAAPSANRFGHISPTTAGHVASEFGPEVSLILDGGPCSVGIESTILDLSRGEPVILRPGMIGADAIATVIGSRPRLPARGEQAPRVSGALAAHYAPRTPMRLMPAAALPTDDESVAVLARHAAPAARKGWIHAPTAAAAYAHDLYANLRALDTLGCRAIAVEAPPRDEAWAAVWDRLTRAEAGSADGS